MGWALDRRFQIKHWIMPQKTKAPWTQLESRGARLNSPPPKSAHQQHYV